MRKLFLLLLILSSTTMMASQSSAHILDVANRRFVTLDQMTQEIKKASLIFIGELHGEIAHHQAQLAIIRRLHNEGVDLAIGLEMFRKENQPTLDAWVNGKIPENQFVQVYNDNWSMWPKYRDIYLYARENHIPMVGLNIPRAITAQVARDGYSSLSNDQRMNIPAVSCDVDQAYMDFIIKSLGAHDHADISFMNFCEAQMLWDTVMAKNLVDYLKTHAGKTVVVLTGGGHAWKHGIPRQVENISNYSYKVILPEVQGRIHPANATPQETDYLLLGLTEGPIH